MQRRHFITILGGVAAIWPLVARAQQPALPVIGFINVTSARNYTRQLAGFLNGLRETGYVDGRNQVIRLPCRSYLTVNRPKRHGPDK
jgi:hypothetical protein